MLPRPSTKGAKPSATSARGRFGSLANSFAGLLRPLGLVAPQAYRESWRLVRQSQGLFALARHVSTSTGSPEDAAALLRKAIYQLFLAVLSYDGDTPSSYEQCRLAIEDSPRYRKLFAAVVDELPFLDELLGSFDLVLDRRADFGERFEQLTLRMPPLYKAVRTHLDGQVRQAGGRPALRRVVLALVIIGAIGLVVIPAYRQTTASAQWGPDELPPPSELAAAEPLPKEVLDDPAKCFEATYFSDQDFNTPVHTRRDCRIDFDWGTEAIPDIPSLPVDLFSVRWVGELEPPASGPYVFYLSSDDGSRLFVDGAKILDNWGNHGPLERSSRVVELTAGKRYSIRVDYYEAGEIAQIQLSWSSPAFDKQVLSGQHVWRAAADGGAPSSPPSAELAELQGDATKCFRAQYYDGTNFDRLVHTRRDCAIDFQWEMGGVPEVANLPVDDFSVRWEGTLLVPETSEYVFHLGSDDGSRLFIEDKLIVGEWSQHGFGFVDSAPLALKEGVRYPIRVEFFERDEVAAIQLMWSSKSITRAPLSGRYVTPAGTGDASTAPSAK